jgi:preprotein translocase subunit SecG
MYNLLMFLFICVSVALVTLVLLQQSAGMGPSSSSDLRSKIISPAYSSRFMTRTISILALIFFISSLAIGTMNNKQSDIGSEWERLSESPDVELGQGKK